MFAVFYAFHNRVILFDTQGKVLKEFSLPLDGIQEQFDSPVFYRTVVSSNEEWIVAQFRSYRSVLLNSELSKTRHILRSVVLGEIRYVSSEMAFKHLGNLEVEIKIAPYIELWQWEGVFLLAELICDADDILPVKDSSLEVL